MLKPLAEKDQIESLCRKYELLLIFSVHVITDTGMPYGLHSGPYHSHSAEPVRVNIMARIGHGKPNEQRLQ